MRSRGEHLAGRGGASTDFADYRDYQPGDEIRNVDWNIFARLHRPYLKIFRLEEERHVSVLIDCSASMDWFDKLKRAQQLASVFATAALIGGERLSVHLAGLESGKTVQLPPVRGRRSLRRALSFIETAKPGGSVPPEAMVDAMLTHHRGRGICLWCSDFLSGGDLDRAFGRLAAAGLECFAAQVLSEEERDPELAGDLRLVDAETGAHLDVSGAGVIYQVYREQVGSFTEGLASILAKHRGRYGTFDPAEPLAQQVADRLIRRGWLA
jgi:uncharacterized protein (DUF58 family)